MKVIFAGYSKTGTKSMNSALTILGLKVYDLDYHIVCHGKEWVKIFTEGGSKEQFYEMYKDVDAVVDLPPSPFWEEILEAFPDAKVIFSSRDEEKWLSSFQKQNEEIENNLTLALCCVLTSTGRRMKKIGGLMGRMIQGSSDFKFPFLKRNWNLTLAMKNYRAHNSAVLMRAPKERLLVYEIGSGWEPLCKFLEKPIPEVPFPHKNKRGEMVNEYLENNPLFLQMQYEAKIAFAVIFAVFSLLIGAVIWAYSL